MMRYAIVAALLVFSVPALAQDIPPPDQVISENDKNGDKAIDRMEWANSAAPIPFPEEADLNKDGKIDLPELTALFASFQNGDAPPPPPAQPAPR